MEAIVGSRRPNDSGVSADGALDPPRKSSLEPAAGAAREEDAEVSGAERRPGQVLWVSSTYFAEGLPYTLAHKVAGEFFTAAGASLQIIGLVSLYHLPWNLKFLWSPLVDLLGGARRWVVAVEIALAVVLFAIAGLAERGALGLVAGGFAVLAAAAATHDIAVDGFYLQTLDKSAQAGFSGLRVAAYRVALLVGGLLVMLAGWASWGACFIVSGLLLALLAALHARLLPRSRAQSAASAPGAGGYRRFFEAFATFMRQAAIARILGFLVLYRAGDALMFAMSSPFLKELGLGTTARGGLSSVGTVAFIAGSILSGMVIARRGLSRTIFPIALTQSLAILLYVALAWLRPATPWVVLIVVLEQLASGIGTAVLMVFLMRRCAAPFKSSHFAIGSALMSVAATVAGSASGYLADRLGFTAFFAIAFVASIPGVVLSRLVPSE